MSKEKQIEEMADFIYENNPCPLCDHTGAKVLAGRLHKACYRKQEKREWISVKERLPAQRVMVIGFCHTAGDDEGFNDRILVMELNRFGQFMPFNCSPIKDNSVTHWMPLPEPPKTKAGESDA